MLATITCKSKRNSVPSRGVEVRPADRVVEREAERLVDLLAALAAVEQVCLDVFQDREKDAASFVCGDVAVGASDATRYGRCSFKSQRLGFTKKRARACHWKRWREQR